MRSKVQNAICEFQSSRSLPCSTSERLITMSISSLAILMSKTLFSKHFGQLKNACSVLSESLSAISCLFNRRDEGRRFNSAFQVRSDFTLFRTGGMNSCESEYSQISITKSVTVHSNTDCSYELKASGLF